jgi:hypothetical protein
MPEQPWQANVRRWRELPPEERLHISLRLIPRKVARSMAFAGQPVDEQMLKDELERLLAPLGLTTRDTAPAVSRLRGALRPGTRQRR